METFTSSSRLHERLTHLAKRLFSSKNTRKSLEISKYLSQIFMMINESPDEQMDIYMRLNTPVVHSDLQRLLLSSPRLTSEDLESVPGMPYESVLNIHLYIKLEEELRDTEYQVRGLTPSDIEREHIFHKLLFDSLNENLDYSRVGGMKGLSPAFFSSFRTPRKITGEECGRILEDCKRQVLDWNGERNGMLAGEDSNMELESIKEEILLRHLRSYVEQMEDKWSEYSDEMVEVVLGIAEECGTTL